MKLDVCICTHNPRLEVFRRVLEAIGQQTLARESFQVWVIDNCSVPPLTGDDLAPLAHAKLHFTLLQEPRPGQIFARAKAIQASHAEWMVFVDDDTVLAPDYLEQVVAIAAENPQVGCFGGKLLLPKTIQVPRWAKPMLPYLAIKDGGDEPVTKCVNEWGVWEPPGGGAAVRRCLLDLYVQRLEQNPAIGRLGRRGARGLFSCDDSFLMRGAYALGLCCSYQPRLRLDHYLAPHRLKFFYLLRLLYGLGRSRVILDRTLGEPVPPAPVRQAWRLLRKMPLERVKCCRKAYEWGYFFESRTQLQNGSGVS